MTRKEFMNKFFDLCKDAQQEIPPNVIAQILRDYADRLDQVKKLFAFVLGLLLLFCPLAVHAEEIAEAPSPDQMSEEALTYLLGEDIYQGTLSWQGNQASTKFNYDMKKKKQIDENIRSFSSHWICPVLVLPKLGIF